MVWKNYPRGKVYPDDIRAIVYRTDLLGLQAFLFPDRRVL